MALIKILFYSKNTLFHIHNNTNIVKKCTIQATTPNERGPSGQAGTVH